MVGVASIRRNVTVTATRSTGSIAVSGRPSPAPPSVVEKAAQLAAPARVLELAQRLGLDLADALARHVELLADLLERMVGVHADAEAHPQHALLAWRQARQHPRRRLAQIGLDR